MIGQPSPIGSFINNLYSPTFRSSFPWSSSAKEFPKSELFIIISSRYDIFEGMEGKIYRKRKDPETPSTKLQIESMPFTFIVVKPLFCFLMTVFPHESNIPEAVLLLFQN